MSRQLSIRNDEVYRLAHEVAADMGKPVAEAMLTLLRAYQHRAPIRQELTAEQRTWLEQLLARHRVREAQAAGNDVRPQRPL